MGDDFARNLIQPPSHGLYLMTNPFTRQGQELEQDELINDAVTMGNPQNYKFDFCLWTLNILRTAPKTRRAAKCCFIVGAE